MIYTSRKNYRWHKLLLALAFPAILLPGCVPVESTSTGSGATNATGTSSTLRYEDAVYSPEVRSVQLYVNSADVGQTLNAPILPLSQNVPLVLEFDRLTAPGARVVVKLHHCDINWQPSTLTDIQFVDNYNEFYITNVNASAATKIPYWHYAFEVPRVKLSGNYVLEAYVEGGELLLSRRFIVYENQVQAAILPKATAGANNRYAFQQMDLSISYGQYPLVNPAQEVKVLVRQNHRWDNAKYFPRPTLILEAQGRLDYQLFDVAQAFLGLNEFRALDTRSDRYSGYGVQSRDISGTPDKLILLPGKSRSRDAYSTQPDANGKFIYGSREYGNAPLNADYQEVTFQLHAPEPAPGPVYIFGGLTDWQLREPYRLTYDATKQVYTGKALLKQGYYNYFFAMKGANGQPDAQYFEGSHFETENIYDMLVYYRPPGTRADLIIGYSSVTFNPQR